MNMYREPGALDGASTRILKIIVAVTAVAAVLAFLAGVFG